MTPEQLLENFKTQQQSVAEELRKLETELLQKKEIYVKLQGAIEGLELLDQEQTKEVEASPEAVAAVLQ
jgi:hypothetical protein